MTSPQTKPQLVAAAVPTMYFIGVTTGESSIMHVFPAWAEHLGIDAVLAGIDLPPGTDPEVYREVVGFIAGDDRSVGALVTTHKLDLLRASRDLFDELDDDARLLDEVSSIAKRGGRLIGHAKDPETSGLALAAIVDAGQWDAEMLVLGAGGASLALTLFLHRREQAGEPVPRRLVVSDSSPLRVESMRTAHRGFGFRVPTEYAIVTGTFENDRLLAGMAARSIVINATGLGKDRPGSPLGDAARFPDGALAWDFNYRGELRFLDQARAQQHDRDLRVVDGWEYFVHGWTRVVAEVFGIDIPVSGPRFEALSQIARHPTTGASA